MNTHNNTHISLLLRAWLGLMTSTVSANMKLSLALNYIWCQQQVKLAQLETGANIWNQNLPLPHTWHWLLWLRLFCVEITCRLCGFFWCARASKHSWKTCKVNWCELNVSWMLNCLSVSALWWTGDMSRVHPAFSQWYLGKALWVQERSGKNGRHQSEGFI